MDASPTWAPTSASETAADILLVEDDSDDVCLTEDALRDARLAHSLHVVESGEAALSFLRDDDAPTPDLVLLDLDLPEMDGCAVLEAIRAETTLRTLPVVVFTKSTAGDDIRRCYDATANAYVTKPSDPAEFASVLEAIDRFWFGQAVLP